MKFRFSLQKVVDLKGNQKRQAQWQLSDAIAVLQSEQTSLTALMNEQRKQEALIQDAAGKPTPILQLQELQDYAQHLQRMIESQLREVSRAQAHVDSKQQQLVECSRDEKVWQKARERAYVAHQALELKMEQETLDELASVRFGIQ